jgi:hypothetical protein
MPLLRMVIAVAAVSAPAARDTNVLFDPAPARNQTSTPRSC